MKVFEIVSLIVNAGLITAIVGQFMFYKSQRRTKNAEADQKEFNTMLLQINHFSQQLKEAYEEIDKMQEIIDRIRNDLVEKSKLLSEVRIQLVKTEEKMILAEYSRCDVTNCTNRQPPKIENNG